MTRHDLYELERDVYKNIDRIKREQAQYVKGVEEGIELVFKAVRETLAKEEENAAKKKNERKDCSNCVHKGEIDGSCKQCIASYDARTNTTSEPSHWEAIPEHRKTKGGAE